MKQSLVRNGYEDFYQILIGGDDFGKPKVQAILDALGQIDPAVFTPSRVETMKSWGVDRRPRWTYEGFVEAPTLASIAAARKAHEDRQAADALKPWYVARDAVVRDGLHKATLTTQSQIVQVFEAD
jgi:hypothetical protein